MKNNKKTIGIIGYGYVGKAMHNFFKDHYNLYVYDIKFSENNSINKEKINIVYDKSDINKHCDFVFICVPTPSKENGECDTSIVEEVVSWIDVPIICIKSTVEPGTTNLLKEKYNKRIVFSPEYCGESSYWTPYKFHTDMKETPFFIFGGDKNDCSELIDLFLPIVGPVKTYKITDSLSAEIAKYMENTFFAMKVIFCNEMYSVCEKVGSDWNDVREVWLLDPRINPMHTAVFKNSRGFGGKCYPKDVNAIISYAEKNNVDVTLLKSIIESNNKIRKINEQI